MGTGKRNYVTLPGEPLLWLSIMGRRPDKLLTLGAKPHTRGPVISCISSNDHHCPLNVATVHLLSPRAPEACSSLRALRLVAPAVWHALPSDFHHGQLLCPSALSVPATSSDTSAQPLRLQYPPRHSPPNDLFSFSAEFSHVVTVFLVFVPLVSLS